MAPSMRKEVRGKKQETLGVKTKTKGVKKMKVSLQREEVERSLKIAERIAQQEAVQMLDDDLLSEVRSKKKRVHRGRVSDDVGDGDGDGDVGFVVVEGEDDVAEANVTKVREVEVDDRVKRPKQPNSLRSLRLAIAAKMKKVQDKEVSQMLKKKGLSEGDDD